VELKGLAEVDFGRGIDEVKTTAHDAPDKTNSIENVGLGKREDVIDRRQPSSEALTIQRRL